MRGGVTSESKKHGCVNFLRKWINSCHFNFISVNSAFTLAEVLITLGIIGVVAALTLSAVINKINDKQNIAKWKKEYSVISNAFNNVVASGVPVCEYTQRGACYGQAYTDDFLVAMWRNLNVVDYCGVQGNDKLTSGKICDYFNGRYRWSGLTNIYSGYKALGVIAESNPDTYSPYGINAYNFYKLALLLSDGAVAYFGELWSGPWVVVDVNNFQNGPNEFGRDVFVMNIQSNIRTNKHFIAPAGSEAIYYLDNANLNKP